MQPPSSTGIERLAGLPAPGGRTAARRHRRGDRPQRPARFCQWGDQTARSRARAAAHRGPGPFRGAGLARRPGGSVGRARTIAVSLYKCATDIRWMGSGPVRAWLRLRIPDLQPGSSIMPGKVNPVIPEAVSQVVAQVIGNDAAVAFGGAAGNFELNVMLPVIARNLLESLRLLANVSRLFADRCIAGIEADVDRCRTYALSSPAIATALNPYIGYEEAAKVVKRAVAEGKDLRSVVLEQGLLDEEEVDRALDVEAMTRGGIIK